MGDSEITRYIVEGKVWEDFCRSKPEAELQQVLRVMRIPATLRVCGEPSGEDSRTSNFPPTIKFSARLFKSEQRVPMRISNIPVWTVSRAILAGLGGSDSIGHLAVLLRCMLENGLR